MDIKFDCIYYYVRDLDRSIAFYSDVLGFKLSSRDAVARLYVDDVLVELVPEADQAKLVGNGNARLCLEVCDIQEAVSTLRAKGVPARDIRSVDRGRVAEIEDPDGNEVVLWQYT
jgi:catechol 2,3-dioxygenase-like lactoylglutathione lyase family enzyme